MNGIIQRQWAFILEEADKLGMPVANKRGIAREFLQTKILDYIFRQKNSIHISFMGGTCLRIAYGLNRFSEDLDFDLFSAPEHMVSLVEKAGENLNSEGYTVKLHSVPGKNTVTIKFPGLPYAMGFSPHESENLQIKVDWDIREKVFEPEVFLLSRFGVIQRIRINPESVILAEKIAAVKFRKRPIPRDFYDIIYLLTRNVLPDIVLMANLGVPPEKAAETLISGFSQLNITQIENELKPFLFEPGRLDDLSLFPDLIKDKLKEY